MEATRVQRLDVRPSTVVAALIILAFAVGLIWMSVTTTDGDSGPGQAPAADTTSDAPFGSEEFCRAEAPRLLRENPSVYYTLEEAYRGCREAGEIADELGDR